jgi:Fur family ferric uptake transcriptional regulator
MHQSESDYVQQLRGSGFKITPVREAVLHIIYDQSAPLAVPELADQLAESGLTPNKTTLYREVEFLLQQRIIQEIDLGDGKKRYEKKSEHCHHHLVCTSCQKIECVDLDDELHQMIHTIEQKTNFTIYEHMLEFFGMCKKCKLNQ